MNNLINGKRLWNDIMSLGIIGGSDNGGVTRISFDQKDIEARKYLLQLLEELELHPYMDQAGNIFGELRGQNPDLPPILIGSHIDTVNSGGRFDGAMGVLMGVEVLRTLKETRVKLDRTVKVVSLTDEEGARFDYAFVGSSALIGLDTLQDDLRKAADENGISYFDVMERVRSEGGHFESISPGQIDKAESTALKAYIEVHIEQGKILESKNLGVGIVTGISGGDWSEVTIIGEAGHAGTIGMKERKDALAAASECILSIEQIAQESGGSVATVGKMEVKPGSSNVIPGKVNFTLDVRDITDERRQTTVQKIYQSIQAIAENRGVTTEIKPIQSAASVMSSKVVVDAIKGALSEMEYPIHVMPSGAAHDAMIMGELTDIGMIFVRSKNGISHHPDEWSSFEDVALGCEVLYRTVLRLV